MLTNTGVGLHFAVAGPHVFDDDPYRGVVCHRRRRLTPGSRAPPRGRRPVRQLPHGGRGTGILGYVVDVRLVVTSARDVTRKRLFESAVVGGVHERVNEAVGERDERGDDVDGGRDGV